MQDNMHSIQEIVTIFKRKTMFCLNLEKKRDKMMLKNS